jgi:hypothetical protein
LSSDDTSYLFLKQLYNQLVSFKALTASEDLGKRLNIEVKKLIKSNKVSRFEDKKRYRRSKCHTL